MKKIDVTIKGILPLLQNKMTLSDEAQLASKIKKGQGQSKADDPKEKLYLVGGDICQPAEHIRAAIIKQLSNYKIQGRGKKTYKELGQGALNIFPDMIKHKIQKWETDTRTVVIKATKGRVVRVRPKLSEWELSFQVVLMNDNLPVEVIKAALDDAGREGGLGDYRPRFGLFMVTEFKEN